MTITSHLDDLLARLERERLAADRIYNDALTALDRALSVAAGSASHADARRSHASRRLNARWNILPDGAPPIDRSLKGRVCRLHLAPDRSGD